MSIRTRRLLFYFLSFLFITISFFLVAYSLGLKPDFTNLSFKATGGIYLRSEPAQVDIYLDGEAVENQSGLLQSGTFMSNLKEGRYKLHIKKDGYFDWKKNVDVKNSLVEALDSIVLVSTKGLDKLNETADKFYVANHNLVSQVANELKTDNGKLLGNSVNDITDDGTVITYNSANKTYYKSNIFTPGAALNVNTLFNNLKESRLALVGAVPIMKVAIHPFNHSKLIVQSRGALYNLDTARLTIEQIAEAPIDFKAKGQELVFYDKKNLYKHNLIFRTTAEIAALSVGEVEQWELASDGKVAMLLKSGELLVFLENGKVMKVAEKAAMFALSDNNDGIAFRDYDGPLYVYQLEKEKYLKLETGINETINDLRWYKDSEHLFIKAGNNLYFTEVDENLPLNTTRLASDVREFTYQPDGDSLYILTPNGVFKFEI